MQYDACACAYGEHSIHLHPTASIHSEVAACDEGRFENSAFPLARDCTERENSNYSFRGLIIIVRGSLHEAEDRGRNQMRWNRRDRAAGFHGRRLLWDLLPGLFGFPATTINSTVNILRITQRIHLTKAERLDLISGAASPGKSRPPRDLEL